MRYFDDEFNESGWTGVNGFGETIRNPEAYYQAVREDRYGFNSNYTLDQYEKYYDHDF